MKRGIKHSMVLLVAIAVPAFAPAHATDAAQVAARQQRGVEDPHRFVLDTYGAFARSEESMAWPEQSYSPRLRGLFADYDAWTAAQDGLIGELEGFLAEQSRGKHERDRDCGESHGRIAECGGGGIGKSTMQRNARLRQSPANQYPR